MLEFWNFGYSDFNKIIYLIFDRTFIIYYLNFEFKNSKSLFYFVI